jgi:hypothetical protein
MTSSGILTFLADRFNVWSREVLMTEGLGYLLQEYPTARETVVNVLATDMILPETRDAIAFISQARSADDSWVVDLEGQVDECVYISIEGKLDARLQPSQPVDYVGRLEEGGSLLLLCPYKRIPRLSRELQQRAARGGLLAENASWARGKIWWIPLIRRPLNEAEPDFVADDIKVDAILSISQHEIIVRLMSHQFCIGTL